LGGGHADTQAVGAPAQEHDRSSVNPVPVLPTYAVPTETIWPEGNPASSPRKFELPGGFGTLTARHLEPSHRSIRVAEFARSWGVRKPLAHVRPPATARPTSASFPPPGLSLGTTDHAAPSQCSARVFELFESPGWVPTACPAAPC